MTSDFTKFCDLETIFPKKTVELLEKVYDSPEDIDLLVGGGLESFSTIDRQLLGQTFSCIANDAYRRFISGDAYFFKHTTSPYPFTPQQIKAITDLTPNHLLCLNSKLEYVNKNWMLVDDSSNPRVPCTNFKPIDLSPWKV